MTHPYARTTTEGLRRNSRIGAGRNGESPARSQGPGRSAPPRPTDVGMPAPLRSSGGRRIAAGDIVAFTRQLSDLTLAGLTLDRSLTVLAEQVESRALRALIESVQVDVRAGAALSQALDRHPRHFPPMVINMLRAGEMSGRLGEVLERLARFAEREQERRVHIVSAMVYPAVLLTVAAATLVFLLTFVVPRLSGVFADLGADLPLPTRLLLALTGALASWWWAILGTAVALAVGFHVYRRTDAGAYQVDRLALRMVLLGKVWRKVVVARFARALGTLVGGGVPILEALRIAGQAAANRTVVRAAEQVEERVRGGETISAALRATGGFPPVLIHMTAVGEETGELARVLLRVAETLDNESEIALKRLTTLIEPVIVLVMGGFVGFIVLSILLPVFQANAIVR